MFKFIYIVIIFFLCSLVQFCSIEANAYAFSSSKVTKQYTSNYSNSPNNFSIVSSKSILQVEDDEEFEEEEEEFEEDSTEEEEEFEEDTTEEEDELEEDTTEEEVEEKDSPKKKPTNVDESDEEELEEEEFEEEEEESTPTISKPKTDPKDTDFFEDTDENSTDSEDEEEELEEEENTVENYVTIAPKFKARKNLGQIESSTINEASGLVASRITEGVLWTHNDSGGEPEVYAISNEGYILAAVKINGLQHPASKNATIINRDWEDIAIGPGPKDETDYIYVGDIGDNNAIHGTCFIYRFEEPFVEVDQDSSHITIQNVETIAYKYEDGARDAETMFVDPNSGDIYIVSKREDSVGVYVLEYPHSTTEVLTAQKVATLPFTSAVGGDISPEGDEIIIKNYLQIFYWTVGEDESIASALKRTPAILPYTPEPQGEAVCFDPENLGYYTLSEEPLPTLQSSLFFYERIEDEVTSVDEEENDGNDYGNLDESPTDSTDDADYMRYLAFSEGGKKVLDERMHKILNNDFHLHVINLGLNNFSISAYMKTSMFVSLDVYDINGNLIHEVFYGKLNIGPSNFLFDASSLIAGTYFVQIRTSHGAWTEKILVW